ncbi:DUF6976 family protein [Sedimenticola sp.]|uniref:DUF6976 family protein n=1 Tax=Sedimenticola sp. TaxID=1940285 RepID=UPI003D0FAEBF
MNQPATVFQGLVTRQQAVELINKGHALAIAADESLLKKLPKGFWIGGTIPYFMDRHGGTVTRDKLFINDLTGMGYSVDIRSYTTHNLPLLVKEAPDNGFSLIILPGGSHILADYAKNAPDYEDMFLKPIIGWVSGHHLDDGGSATPKVINGLEGELLENQAVVMHIGLPETKIAQLDIVNLFRQDEGHTFRFPESGFTAGDCLIDGKSGNLAQFLKQQDIDTRLPLVADYSGAMVNVSIKNSDSTKGTVEFYAPVFSGVDYKLAAPVADYIDAFMAATPSAGDSWVFSCNCILNYLYMELEGKQTANITGPFTFGEIAYQLLNQTLVYLSVEDQ